VTHVIRGDDHLTNTFRQIQIYRAMGWDLPEFAHIPLIHGADGAKLSKRHGALGVDAYRDMGYLPEAVRNYLLRLGWGHGDDEIISTEQAIEWFDLGGIGRSPSRFDFAKLDNLNAHYMRLADDARLVGLIVPLIEAKLGRPVGQNARDLLTRAMPGLKQRAKTLVELADSAHFYVDERPLKLTDKAAELVTGEGASILADLAGELRLFDAWEAAGIEAKVRQYAENKGLKLGKVAQPLRAALSGSTVSPPIFEVAELLGKTESLARIADIAQPR
jgi:glutamyl-tRNA synthetase